MNGSGQERGKQPPQRCKGREGHGGGLCVRDAGTACNPLFWSPQLREGSNALGIPLQTC